MTREEAGKILQKLATNSLCVEDYSNDKIKISSRMGAQAPRPASREQVERMRGEWMFPIFGDQQDANDPRCQCSECGSIETPLARHRFCPSCGAPMTDEAVQMVMERLEALKDEAKD